MFRHFAGPFFLIFSCFQIAAQCPITVSAGPDVVKCGLPATTQLMGSVTGSYLSLAWTPSAGMTNSTTLTPTVNPTTTTTYTLTATALDASINLITNGDFESGNVAFSSDYNYNPGDLYPEGVYDVLPNPAAAHPDFAGCSDHTGGGNMMAINGSASASTDVWCQTVSVTPNTQYVFTAWATSLVASSPARLQFSINGGTIGSIFNVSSQTCNWQNFYAVWNSGSATSATICIVNQNTMPSGNDFAIDDIVFSPTCRVTDMVQVEVVNLKAMAAAATVTLPCAGATATLNGTGSSVGPGIMYEWTTVGGNIVSGANSLNPVVNAPGPYTLRVFYETASGVICEKFVTVNVFYNSNPLTAIITPPGQLGCGAATITLVGNATPSIANVTWQWSVVGSGHIVGSTTNKNCVVNQAGYYQLTATNTVTGCTSTAIMPVTAETSLPVANASSDTINCIHPTATLSGAGSSTGAGITYQWTTTNGSISSGQNTQNAVAGAPGTYILAVTNTANSCVVRDTVVVISNKVLPYAQIDPPPNIDCDSDTIGLFVHLSPPPFVLLVWTAENGGNIASGQYTPAPMITAPGTYILHTTDPINGCVSIDTVGVTSNFTPPIAASLPADSLTCQRTSVVLSGNGSSTGGNFGYQWAASNGGNIVMNAQTLSPEVNAPGSYTLTVLNYLNGCTATSTVLVAADTNAVTAVAHVNDTLDCSTLAVTLNTNGSSVGNTFTYDWTTATGTIQSGDDTPAPVVTDPGIYQLTMTNTANGCSATTQVEVLENVTPPAVQVAAPNELTCAVPTQSVTATPVASGADYSYVWTASSGGNILSGDQTATINVNAAGTYQVQVTNADNGCTATFSVAVTQEAGIPVAMASTPGPLTCAVTSQTLGSTGSSTGSEYVYSWTAANGGVIVSGDTGPSPLINKPGTYILHILNQTNGCSNTDTVAVTENIQPPLAEAGTGDTLTCAQTQFVLTGNENIPSAGLTMQWSTGNGHFVTDPNNTSVTCDEAGTYLLQVRDNVNGCISVDSLVMRKNKQAPDLLITPPFPLTCTVTSVNLSATATGSSNLPPLVRWTTNDGNILSGDSTYTPLVDAPGTYLLTATDPANGCTTTGGAVLNEYVTPPDVSISPAVLLTCTTTSQALQAQNQASSGVFSYNWTPSNGGHISTGDTTLTPTINMPGRYLLTAVNTVNGCTAQDSIDVLQNITPPAADAGTGDTLNCINNSLTINGSASGQGALTLQWTAQNNGSIPTGGNTLSPTVSEAGWYLLHVTDQANGCQAKDSVQVFQDANIPIAEAGQPATLTCQTTQLNLQGSASTGNNYTYLWTTTNGNISGDPATLNPAVNDPGTYYLAVTNTTNGCIRMDSVIISENVTPPQFSISPAGLLTCTTVSLQLSTQTTIANGAFQWSTTQGHIVSGGSTSSPVINLPGAYDAVLTDPVNGCSSTESITVGSNTNPPVVSAVTPAALTCAQTQRTLAGAVTQPANNYSVQWTTNDGTFVSGQNTLAPVVSEAGTYQMNVLDQSNGCNAFVTVTLGENTTPPVAVAGSVDPITCDNTVVSLNSTGSSTGTNITYAWNGQNIVSGAGTATPQVSGTGPYTLTVTNQTNGCVATASATVATNTTPPVIAIASPASLTCVSNSVLIDAGASSQGAGFQATWTTATGHFISGQNAWTATVDVAAPYTLTIENTVNGCTAIQTVSVNQNITPPGASIEPAETLNCNRQEIDLQANSSVSNANYAWNTTNGQIATGAQSSSPTIVAPGLYRVVVTNPSNGCASTAQTTVGEVQPPEFEPVAWQPDCHVRTGAIDFGSVTAGSAPFQYSLNGGQSYGSETSFESLEPGVYELVVQDNDGCTTVENVEIITPFYPEVTLGAVNILALGESVQLSPVVNLPASSVASWEWSPAIGLSCADCPEPVALPVRDAAYTLTIKDLNGCEAQASTLLRVNTTRVLYPPNVISPNGDGKGDFFNLFGKGVEDITWLRVYDRWGNQLYDVEHLPINEELQGWNGVFRGQPVNPGVFVWQAQVKFIDGVSEIFSGDITVVR